LEQKDMSGLSNVLSPLQLPEAFSVSAVRQADIPSQQPPAQEKTQNKGEERVASKTSNWLTGSTNALSGDVPATTTDGSMDAMISSGLDVNVGGQQQENQQQHKVKRKEVQGDPKMLEQVRKQHQWYQQVQLQQEKEKQQRQQQHLDGKTPSLLSNEKLTSPQQATKQPSSSNSQPVPLLRKPKKQYDLKHQAHSKPPLVKKDSKMDDNNHVESTHKALPPPVSPKWKFSIGPKAGRDLKLKSGMEDKERGSSAKHKPLPQKPQAPHSLSAAASSSSNPSGNMSAKKQHKQPQQHPKDNLKSQLPHQRTRNTVQDKSLSMSVSLSEDSTKQLDVDWDVCELHERSSLLMSGDPSINISLNDADPKIQVQEQKDDKDAGVGDEDDSLFMDCQSGGISSLEGKQQHPQQSEQHVEKSQHQYHVEPMKKPSFFFTEENTAPLMTSTPVSMSPRLDASRVVMMMNLKETKMMESHLGHEGGGIDAEPSVLVIEEKVRDGKGTGSASDAGSKNTKRMSGSGGNLFGFRFGRTVGGEGEGKEDQRDHDGLSEGSFEVQVPVTATTKVSEKKVQNKTCTAKATISENDEYFDTEEHGQGDSFLISVDQPVSKYDSWRHRGKPIQIMDPLDPKSNRLNSTDRFAPNGGTANGHANTGGGSVSSVNSAVFLEGLKQLEGTMYEGVEIHRRDQHVRKVPLPHVPLSQGPQHQQPTQSVLRTTTTATLASQAAHTQVQNANSGKSGVGSVAASAGGGKASLSGPRPMPFGGHGGGSSMKGGQGGR
jgi:hypothetical protein